MYDRRQRVRWNRSDRMTKTVSALYTISGLRENLPAGLYNGIDR